MTVALDRGQLLDALDLDEADIPVALILEGSWWQQQRNKTRLALLDDPRELNFPEMHLGRHLGCPVLYSCVYGAPRAVEPVHVFGSLGSRRVVMIGSCGALQPDVRTGDVIVATHARIGEGASQYYGGDEWAEPTAPLVNDASTRLRARDLRVHQGPLLTTSALFAQPLGVVEGWRRDGYLGVEMETSAVFTAARALQMEAISLVFAWDELYGGRTFLDTFSDEERRAQQHANDAIYEVALELAVGADSLARS